MNVGEGPLLHQNPNADRKSDACASAIPPAQDQHSHSRGHLPPCGAASGVFRWPIYYLPNHDRAHEHNGTKVISIRVILPSFARLIMLSRMSDICLGADDKMESQTSDKGKPIFTVLFEALIRSR